MTLNIISILLMPLNVIAITIQHIIQKVNHNNSSL
jgi:hypothetical protein